MTTAALSPQQAAASSTTIRATDARSSAAASMPSRPTAADTAAFQGSAGRATAAAPQRAASTGTAAAPATAFSEAVGSAVARAPQIGSFETAPEVSVSAVPADSTTLVVSASAPHPLVPQGVPQLLFDPAAASAAAFSAAPAPADTAGLRTVAPAEIFGASSVRASMPYGGAAPRDPLATAPYGAAVLLLLVVYGTLLYRHTGDALHLLGHLRSDRTPNKRIYEDTAGSYDRFLTLCTVLGLFALGMAAVRFGTPWLPQRLLLSLPRTAALLCSLAVSTALGGVLLCQFGALAGIGALTFNGALVERLWLVKRSLSALAMLLATPPLLLVLLMPVGANRLCFWMIIGVLLVSAVLWLRETLTLFLAKKISILHWFLYLCIVEMFPLSLCILLAERSMQ